jgi:hypothetical protein
MSEALMDYSYEAFGPFEPQQDRDAAAKFALNALLMDGRIDDLAALLTPGGKTSGLGGEPGWEIDRIESDGPANIRFRAFVDPEDFALAHPERTYDEKTFRALLDPMLAVYARHNPGAKPVIAGGK